MREKCFKLEIGTNGKEGSTIALLNSEMVDDFGGIDVHNLHCKLLS